MLTYSPKNIDNLVIHFTIVPGERINSCTLVCLPEIEILSLDINDKPAGDELEQILLESHGDAWEEEILNAIQRPKHSRPNF